MIIAGSPKLSGFRAGVIVADDVSAVWKRGVAMILVGFAGFALAGWLTVGRPLPGHHLGQQGSPPVAVVSGVQPVAASLAEHLRVQVLATYPHDPTAFTEGLIWRDGMLYESTGLYGRSTLRRVNLETGQVLQQTPLDPRLFGEGVADVGDNLIQLTWRENRALVYDLDSLQKVLEYQYPGEGWGLCYDGSRLVMSDGSSTLTFRDPQTFEPIGTLPVTVGGSPIDQINELECVGDHVYANVWMTDTILRINADTGQVDATIDASGLLTPEEKQGADVLNGIAYDPDDGTFLITGKLWPKLFKVQFVSTD
jgi:glutaminyl-peptide cyclotransferase